MIYNYTVSLTAPKPTSRQSIDRLEAHIAHNLDQVDCPVRDHFAPGVYVRDQFIPKGTVVVGCVHRTEHLAVVTKGRIALSDGVTPTQVFEAGDVIHSMPGVKRAAVAIEDSRVINIHSNPTDETDMGVLCGMFVEASADQLLGGPNNKQLELQKLRAITMENPQ